MTPIPGESCVARQASTGWASVPDPGPGTSRRIDHRDGRHGAVAAMISAATLTVLLAAALTQEQIDW